MLPKISRVNLRIILLIFALGFICYGNTLSGPFVFDDWQNISFNGHIRIHNLSPAALADAAFGSPLPSRPIANLSFALNYLLHGYWLPGYHLTNIAIHCLTGILLFLLLKGTLTTPALKTLLPAEKATPVALASTLLWLVHPLNTQSVSYLVQRMNSLAALFFLLSLLLYLQARSAATHRPGYFAGCLLSGLLALGSKEIAVTLPLLIFLYEWYFFQDLDKPWLKKQLPWLAGAAIVLAVVGWLYLGRNFSSFLAGYQARDFTLGERLLTEPRVVCRYLGLIFFPYPGLLNLDYAYPLSTGLLQPPTTILALAALAVLSLTAILAAPRQRLLSFSILWFLLNLLIESSILPLEIIFEHRTYLPAMLLWVPLLTLVWQLPERKRNFALGGALVLLLLFATWTFQRNQVWADELALNRDIVAKSPNKVRARANLGRALIRASQEQEGLQELNLALQQSPNHPIIYLNFGYYYLEKHRYDEAISSFKKVIELSPSDDSVYCYLSKAYLGNKQYQEAITAARNALINPAFREETLLTLAIASSESGDMATAVKNFRELAESNPNNGRYRFNLGRALEKTGQKELALGKYREALSIVPDTDKGVIEQAIANLKNTLP